MTDTPQTNEALQAENARLHKRIDQLLQSMDERSRNDASFRETQQLVQFLIDSLPYAIYWKNRDLVYQGCNLRFANDVGLESPEDIIGKRDSDLPWQPGEAEQFEKIDQRIMDNCVAEQNPDETAIYPDGTQEWFESYKSPLLNDAGEVIGIVSTYLNVTQRKLAEQKIDAQAIVLAELSTPLMPIADGVIVMPLVGAIDSRRAQQIMEALLEGINTQQAEIAILDITGVKVVDTQVASALLRTARAAELLGAHVILTGISAEVAQALVHLGAGLGGVITRSNLQSGIAYALSTLHTKSS